MPAPLYSDLRPPFHVVHRYYRASMRCWHDDKRKNYPFLNDTQWKEIKRIVDDSYVKLMHGNDDVIYPRFLIESENPKQMGRGFVPLEHSKFWTQIEKPSHLALYNSTCACTLSLALNPKRTSLTAASNASLEQHCPCTLETALQVYIWFWKNSLPPMGIQHDWYRESTGLSPRTSFFDAILYAMSMVSKDFWTSEGKIQLHKNRWLDRVDLIIASRTDKVLETYFLELEAEKEKKRVEEQQVWYEGFKAAEKAEAQTLLNRHATSSRTWQWRWG